MPKILTGVNGVGATHAGPVDSTVGFRHGSSAMPIWTTGAGTPEGAVTAPIGSLFSRTDGGTDTAVYRKEMGGGNTGWVAMAASGVTSVDGRTGVVTLTDLYVPVDGIYAGATTDVLKARVTGNAQPRFTVNADGKLEWGDGTAAADTVLYRSAVDTLRTDDTFQVGTYQGLYSSPGGRVGIAADLPTDTALLVGSSGSPNAFNSATSVYGIRAYGINTGTGNVTGLAAQGFSSGSTVNALYGASVSTRYTNTTGTATNAIALSVGAPAISAGALVTNAYAIDIAAQLVTGVTTSYGIYQRGASDLNFFAGTIQVGGTQVINLTSTGRVAIAAAVDQNTMLHIGAGSLNFAVDAGTVTGAWITPFNSGTANNCGLYLQPTSSGAVAVGQLTGANINVRLANAAGTCSTGRAAWLRTPTISAGGVITTAIGIDIEAQLVTGVTSAYGLYQRGTTDYNVLLGSTGLGVTAPSLSRLQFPAGTTLADGITWGTDTNLYRLSANVLRTDDQISCVGMNLNQNEIQNQVSHKLPTPPSTPVEGQRYYDTALKLERFYNGTSWVSGGGGGVTSVDGRSGVVTLSDLYVDVAGDNVIGNLGLGAPSPTAKLQFASDTTSAGGILFGTDTTFYRGGPDTLKTDDQLLVQCSIDKATLLQGANIRPVNVGVGDVYGIDVLAGTSTSANQVVGVNVGMSQANISGLIQNYYGVRVVPPALATGSGFWNGYAVYIDAQGPTGVITASYGVYQVGATERNYFNGNVGLGTISPTLSRLQFVAGTTVADGITFGTDTNLYRSAANVLSTDDTFVSAATVQAAPTSGFRQGASGPVWLAGAGTPEGAVTAPIGSIYSRTDGTTGTALYRKETGVSNTGWAAVASSGGVTSVDGRSGVVTLSDLYLDVAGDNMTGNLGLGFPSPTHKLQFAAATTLVGGISFGTDTHLYRGGTTSLVTDSKLTLGGVLDCPDAAGDKALWSSTTFLTGTAATTLYHDVPANSVHEFRAAGLWRTRISNSAVTHNTSIYLDLAGNELRNAVTQNLASAPGTPVEGLRYYDSTLKVERFWNGSSWVGGGGVAAHATSHYAGGSDPLTGKLGLNTSTRAGDGGNVVVGASAMPLSSSGSCTAVGVFAMKAQDLGYNNTAVGYDCCPDLVNSYQNVAVGLWAGKGMASGYNNVAIGFTSNVADWSTGAVAIGANTAVMANNIAIGVGVTAMHDNAVGIGGSSTATNDFVLGTATHLVRAPGMLGLGTIPTARLHLVADTVAAGGILFGTDTNLYRSAASVLTTDNTFASGVTVQAALSKTAGGFRHGASGPTWVAGTGTPESVVTAPIGSIYSRTDGAAGTAFYRKETGTGNTGWSAVAAGGGGVTSVDSRTGVVTLTDKYLQLSGGTLAEAANIALGATTGSKIGTAITQKLGFWNAAPVIQNTGWSVTAGYTADKSFNPESTTLTEVARALGTLIDAMKTYGLLG